MSDETPPSPPAVPGDTKDWTWVLNRRCPECRFDAAAVDRNEVAVLLLEAAHRWTKVLDRPVETLRQRPTPDVWSPVEYAAHVRDVFALYSARLRLMLTEDGPHYPDWNQDATAVEKRYDLSVPSDVAEELRANAELLAAQFRTVQAEAWDRTGFRSDGAAFTVESFARYFIHDPIHHLHDVGVQLNPSTEA